MVEAVESIQLALFLRDPPPLSALELWRSVHGSDPAGFSTLAPGHTQAQAALSSGNLNLMVQASRVDLMMQGLPKPSSFPVSMGNPELAKQEIAALASKIIPSLRVGRTAAVIQGFNLASDAIDSVAKVSTLVHGMPVPRGCEELMFQAVTSRSSSTLHGRELKYICRWQTVRYQLIEAAPNGLRPVAGDKYAAHVYVDVALQADESLDTEQAISALTEVFDAAHHVSDVGYDAIS